MRMQCRTQQAHLSVLLYLISREFQKKSQEHYNVRTFEFHSNQLARTLQQEFPKPKDKLNTNNTRDIVYRINCSDCDFSYYGQTNRPLKIRIKQHKRAVQHNDKNSKIAQHVEKYEHRMDFENAIIVSKIIMNNCFWRHGIPRWIRILAMTMSIFQIFIGL